MVMFEGSSIKMAVGWIEGIGPHGDGAIKVTKHGGAKNGVNGDVVTESKTKVMGMLDGSGYGLK
jgi:hypothetical protein